MLGGSLTSSTFRVRGMCVSAGGISGSVWFSDKTSGIVSVPEQSLHGVYSRLVENRIKIC